MEILKENQFLGLIKFYRKENEGFLDSLLSGFMHCQTPENYRMSNLEGVSDKRENCILSYRPVRGDKPIKLAINEHELNINDITSLTIQNNNQRDAWMQCWLSLRLPGSEEDLEKLKKDIILMKTHFGYCFAFLPSINLDEFIKRIKHSTDKELHYREVVYSNDSHDWSNFCKSTAYSYQREYRFIFGKCSDKETEAYTFKIKEGLGDIIYKNPELKLSSNIDESVWIDFLELGQGSTN